MRAYEQMWETVAEDIKEDIINGHYKSQERLKEAELAAKYSVSKTPVREALRYLESIGFVEIIPHTMARVKPIDKQEAGNLYSIQSVLEALAVRQAIPNLKKGDYEKMEKCITLEQGYSNQDRPSKHEQANMDFHEFIWRASNNKNLIELTNNIYEQCQRYRVISRCYPGIFKNRVPDHREILDAIIAKDIEKAEGAMRRHIEDYGKTVLALLDTENPSEFSKNTEQEALAT